MYNKDSIQTVKDGEGPFYEPDNAPVPSEPPKTIPYSTDSDTVQGFQAVKATVSGPNKLVATGSSGTLPTAVMPGVSGTGTSANTLTIVNGVITHIA